MSEEKEISKKLKEIEKLRASKLKELEQEYNKNLKGMDDSRIKKGRVFAKAKVKDSTDIRFWTLVNAESLKEFIKYGSNKILDQIRVRSHAATIAREEIAKMKKKQGIDLKAAAITVAVISIIATMVFVVVTNFLDYDQVAEELRNTKIQVGEVSGNLAACETELYRYKPQSPSIAPPAGPNVLEG